MKVSTVFGPDLNLRYFDPEQRINRTPLQGAWLLRGWLVSGATKSPATSIIPRLLTIATYIGRAPMPIGRLRAIEENPMPLFCCACLYPRKPIRLRQAV